MGRSGWSVEETEYYDYGSIKWNERRNGVEDRHVEKGKDGRGFDLRTASKLPRPISATWKCKCSRGRKEETESNE